MAVVGSDGRHVGTVDNLGMKFTKNDPVAHDQHHYIKLAAVSTVQDGKLVLNIRRPRLWPQRRSSRTRASFINRFGLKLDSFA